MAEETTVASEAVSDTPVEEQALPSTPVEVAQLHAPFMRSEAPPVQAIPAPPITRRVVDNPVPPEPAQPKYTQFTGASRSTLEPTRHETAMTVTRKVLDADTMRGVEDGPRKVTVPGWLISVLTMLTLLAACISIWLYISTNPAKDSRPAAPATATPPAAAANSKKPQPTLTKYLEVSGLRLSTDSAHKSSVQYLIVNHSAAELADVKLTITVRSASGSAQQAPLCVFNTTIAALNAYESREFSTPIEIPVHSLEVPDWTNLRAELAVNQ